MCMCVCVLPTDPEEFHTIDYFVVSYGIPRVIPHLNVTALNETVLGVCVLCVCMVCVYGVCVCVREKWMVF